MSKKNFLIVDASLNNMAVFFSSSCLFVLKMSLHKLDFVSSKNLNLMFVVSVLSRCGLMVNKKF